MSLDEFLSEHGYDNEYDALKNKFANAVAELIKAREKFYYYINYDLMGYDTEDLNKTLKQKKTNNKERFHMLRDITDNIFTTLQKDGTVNFRDFFIIKEKRAAFTSYLKAKGLTSNS